MPGAGSVTPGPTASTIPAPSWPITAGQRIGSVPSIAFRSEWQIPPACSRTRTSPGPGAASSSASTAGARADAVEDGGADPQLSAPRATRSPGGACWSSRSSSTE